MDRHTQSALDGIGLAQAKHQERRTYTRRLLPWWRVGTIGTLVVFLVALIVVSSLVLPIAHALPAQTFSDRVALAQLALPGRYLVLFQNNHELRPTGGFIGSFAEVELGWGGAPEYIRVETNIYARDNAFASQLAVDPPEPMREFLGGNPWALRDANWAMDFPEAAKTLAWFYQNEGGQPVNGVIALDTRLLERVVGLVGPVTMPSDGTVVTSANIVQVLQEEIERNYWERPENRIENQPKTILAQLLPELLKRLTQVDLAKLVTELTHAAHEKEFIVAHANPTLAKVFARLNWDGHITNQTSDEDYLYINEANLTPVDGTTRIVGAKSSQSIKQKVLIVRNQAVNSQLNHQITLLRDHVGAMVWPDGPNRSFLRIAVPFGAVFRGAWRDGQDISSEIRESIETDKVVYGFWSELQPGESETLKIEYDIPELVVDSPFILQRQPGAPTYAVELWNGGQLAWQDLLVSDTKIE